MTEQGLSGQRTIYDELLLTRPDAQQLKSDIVEFGNLDPRNKRFLSTCGLYIVGSSLVRMNPNDIDITLVGLDFRSVFTYGKRFLNGPQESDSTAMEYTYDLKPTPMMFNLLKELFKKRQMEFDSFDCDYIPWITQLNPWYKNEEYEAVGLKVPLGDIDFFIHGENLLPKYWKEEQAKNKRPYEVLHEWENAKCESVFERSIMSTQELPSFINPFGKN